MINVVCDRAVGDTAVCCMPVVKIWQCKGRIGLYIGGVGQEQARSW